MDANEASQKRTVAVIDDDGEVAVFYGDRVYSITERGVVAYNTLRTFLPLAQNCKISVSL